MNKVEPKVRLTELFNQVWEGFSGEMLRTIREGMEALLEKARDNIVQRPTYARSAGRDCLRNALPEA